MNELTLVLIVLLVVGALSLILYGLGFRLKKLKIKWGFGEADLERKPAGDAQKPPASPPAAASQPAATRVDQQATEGGIIRKSPIKAPADAGAHITQKASGDKSRVDESSITLE